jgi:hypothetical protein
MAGWPSRTPSLPIVSRRLPATVRVVVPEVVIPDRPALPIRGDGRRPFRNPEGTGAYRNGSRPWVGALVDVYG